jgi:hypothetical protein
MLVCGVNSGDGDGYAGLKRFGASIGIAAPDVKRPDHKVSRREQFHCCPVDGGYDFSIPLQDTGF